MRKPKGSTDSLPMPVYKDQRGTKKVGSRDLEGWMEWGGLMTAAVKVNGTWVSARFVHLFPGTVGS